LPHVHPATAGSPNSSASTAPWLFGGFSTFALLYCVQPLMPLLAHEFRPHARAEQPGAVGVHAGALAVSLLASSVLSDRWAASRDGGGAAAAPC
jgi:YNFM family putative membrane transporter